MLSFFQSREFGLSTVPDDDLFALLQLSEAASDADVTLAGELATITTQRLRERFPEGSAHPVSVTTRAGLTLHLDARDSFAATIASGWLHEQRDFSTFMQLVHPTAVVIDVGANFGLYALHAAHWAVAGRVFAFEPAESVFALLKRNVEENKCGANVRLYPQAVAASSGHARFNVAESISFSSLQDTGRSRIVETSDVDVVALDDVADLANARVDLIKIDVEGGEADVLLGARALLGRSPGAIVLFEHSHKNLSAERSARLREAIGALHALGFNVWRRTSQGGGEKIDALPAESEAFSGNLYLAREGSSAQRLLSAMQRTKAPVVTIGQRAALALLNRSAAQTLRLKEGDSSNRKIAAIAESLLGDEAPEEALAASRTLQRALLEERQRTQIATAAAARADALDHALEETGAKMTTLRDALDAAKANALASAEQRERAEATYQQKRGILVQTIEDLKAKLAAKEANERVMAEKLAMQRSQIGELGQRLEDKGRQQGDQSEKIERQRAHVAKLTSQIESLRVRVQELTSALNASQKEIVHVRAKLKRYRREAETDEPAE